jgi:hypothetical protein
MKLTKSQFKTIFGTSDGFTSDLKTAIAAAVAQADTEPDNSDLLEEIQKVRISRDHSIAEFNEITASLFKGNWVYAADVERILSDRVLAARSKILGLPTKMSRVLIAQKRDQAIALLSKEVEQMEKDFPAFDPADFRAVSVNENVPGPAEAVEDDQTESEEE